MCHVWAYASSKVTTCNTHTCILVKNYLTRPQPVWLGGLGIILQTERLTVGFLVWAHSWVAGSVPS